MILSSFRKTAAFSAVLLACACSRREAPKQTAEVKAERAAQIRIARAESRTLDRSIVATGSLAADESINLGFEVPGVLARTLVDFGQHVKQGQVLAEIDTRELAIQSERTRAALNQALARIGLSPAQEAVTPDITPMIRQAVAQMEDAKSKYDSAARLVKTGDIAQERFNEIEKLYRNREAVVQAARDELRTQLAAVDGLKAELRLAQKRLSDAVMRAPFDGAVTAKLVSPGQYVKENTPVFTIVKSSPLRLRVDVPESVVGDVKVGTPLEFTTDAAPGAIFRGAVRELNPILDARVRSLTAEARIAANDQRLKPGMFVQVRLVIERNALAITVPKEAIYSVAGLNKVFIVRDGRVFEKKIEAGRQIGDRVEVNGLSIGDAVAVTNLSTLTDGAAVAVKG